MYLYLYLRYISKVSSQTLFFTHPALNGDPCGGDSGPEDAEGEPVGLTPRVGHVVSRALGGGGELKRIIEIFIQLEPKHL